MLGLGRGVLLRASQTSRCDPSLPAIDVQTRVIIRVQNRSRTDPPKLGFFNPVKTEETFEHEVMAEDWSAY
jgi:hypothetical protein